jgi:hypothetical protein
MHLYVVPTAVLREARKSGHIVGEGNRRECSLPNHDRMDKLNGNVLGIYTTSAIAKSDQFPPLVKPLCYIVAGQGNSFDLIHQGKACHPSSLKEVGRDLRECSRLLDFARIVHSAVSPPDQESIFVPCALAPGIKAPA